MTRKQLLIAIDVLILIVIFLIVAVVLGHAQESATLRRELDIAPPVVELTDIEKLKLENEAMRNQIAVLNMQLSEAKYELAQADQRGIQQSHPGMINEMMTAHGLDPKEYTFDARQQKFVKNPEPPKKADSGKEP